MTIQVQQEVLVTLQQSGSSHHAWPLSSSLVDDNLHFFRKKSSLQEEDDDCHSSVEKDDDSVLTLSTASLSDDSDDAPLRVVTFAAELVTAEWTRPYSAAADLADLYYSTEETHRYVVTGNRCLRLALDRRFARRNSTCILVAGLFDENSHTNFRYGDENRRRDKSFSSFPPVVVVRLPPSFFLSVQRSLTFRDLFLSPVLLSSFRQEYRVERKLLSSLDEDDLPADLSSLRDPPGATTSTTAARRISRVVVLHNDTLATFREAPDGDNVPQDFFDTAEFWSGSITWW